ncbi:2-hydroxyacid dehydrogenase [Comamonadaceae bacterium G21597-S1]|nr:2-hydroxyacid dehydrogenase [Comamonadaceae bacterium G21597-S1]
MTAQNRPDTRPEIVAIGGMADWMLAELQLRYRVHDLAAATDRTGLLAQAAQARAAVTTGAVGIDADTVRRLPQLAMLACFGTGYDKVDRAALEQRGILLSNTPGVVATCVADHAMGLLIALVRRITHADRLAHAGVWGKPVIGLTTRVSGMRLGILGLGDIGARVAQRAAGFEMPIGYHNRHRRTDVAHTYFASVRELAEWADGLVVACPGGDATRHLVDAAVLDALGPHGVLVNVARGSVVDEPALAAALAAGRLGGAALDVFDQEPGIPAALAGLDNVVLTPHLAGSTRETWRDAFDLMCANLAAFLAGEPLPTPVR